MPNTPAKVLLIYPPSRTQSHQSCPMGLLMLAAVLEKAGHQVHLLDANAARRQLTTPEIVARTAELRPDVIGMTLVTPLVKEAYRLAASLSGCGAKLIAGGPHATLLPEEPLGYGFDAVVVGEGEPTIVEAVAALRGMTPVSGVQGLVYRLAEGQIQHNAPRPLITDLDALPWPARHLVKAEDYGAAEAPRLHSHLFTSRGCPARCAYCAGGLFGKKFRFHSADRVVDELLMLHREYGTRHFYFVDDAMAMDRQRMERICRRLIGERLGITWGMMTRVDSIQEEMLELARQAGCVQIDYGIESGSPETLQKIHKPQTVEMVRRVVALTRSHGIQPVVFFMLGFPWEDPPAIDETLRLMCELSPHVLFQPAIASILIPFPGTEIYERYKDQYGFARWWVSDERTYDAPQLGRHAFYQAALYRMGVVLDADFFRYSLAMKAKIHEVFRFMLASNLRARGMLQRTAMLLAVDLSRKLDNLSPVLERAVFKGLAKLLRRSRSLRR